MSVKNVDTEVFEMVPSRGSGTQIQLEKKDSCFENSQLLQDVKEESKTQLFPKKEKINQEDETKEKKKKDRGCFSLLLRSLTIWMTKVLIISIYFACVILEGKTAFKHYRDGNVLYFSLTISFLIIPNMIVNVLSAHKYISKSSGGGNKNNLSGQNKISFERKIIRITFHLLLLGPILRELDEFGFWLRKKEYQKDPVKRSEYKDKTLKEAAIVSWLWLVIAFTQNAPQMVLQLYILLQPTANLNTQRIQMGSIFVSLFSMSWRVASNARAERAERREYLLSLPASFVLFLWNFLLIWSRIMALAFFASIFPKTLLCILLVRYIVFTSAIIVVKHYFGDYSFNVKYLVSFVQGLLMLYSFLKPVLGDSGRHQFAFYFITLIENSTMISLWYVNSREELWYRLTAIVMQCTFFGTGLATMIWYYLFLHPKRKIKTKKKNFV